MPIASLKPVADTYIIEGIGAQGSNSSLVCGQVVVGIARRARILKRFDLGPLASSRVIAATLRIPLTQASFPDAPHTLSLYELSRPNWVEMQATFVIYATGQNWTTAGGDYVPVALSTAIVTNGDSSVDLNGLGEFVALHRGGQIDVELVLPEGTGHDGHFLTCNSREAATGFAQLLVEHETPTGAPLQWDVLGQGPLHWSTEGPEPPPLEWNEIASHPVHWS